MCQTEGNTSYIFLYSTSFSVQNCLVCGMEADDKLCVMMNMITIQTSCVLLYFVLWYVNTKLCIA